MKPVFTFAPMLNRLSIGLAGALLCAATYAANPSDWWVDIRNDRAGNIKTFLAQGVDPNELSPKGQPALMQAIRDGAWDVYDILVANRKISLDAINANNETALMYLAVLGETRRAQDLIRRGAQVNRLGWTPLHYAASTGKVETAKMLIANKAIINAPAPDGTTALMMAAHSGSVAMVQLLLDHGADVTVLNLQKLDAADWAREKKHTSLADKLDILNKKILTSRAALRQQNQSSVGQDNAHIEQASDVESLDLEGQRNKPVAADNSATSEESVQPSSSTSRYFDLDRFNEKPNP